MRAAPFFIILLLSFSALAQPGRHNKKPRIEGQREVTIDEDASYTIQFNDLRVRDDDDWFYPWGFTLQVSDGENYSRDGATVIPASNFSGTLTVKVTVHDGTDYSAPFNFKIKVRPVNDKPKIVSQKTSLSTQEEKPLAILLSHLNVEDPDNTYPQDFTLQVVNGNQYSVSGNTITPVKGSAGTISVSVRVSDGAMFSDPFNMTVTVLPGNAQPQIISHSSLTTNEDTPIKIELSHFIIEDADSKTFTLKLEPGQNYAVDGTLVIPKEDFFGKLSVKTLVNDGVSDSPPYSLPVDVLPVNDPPEIIAFETEPIPYEPDQGPVYLTQIFDAIDVENDSIVKAEIGFISGQYRIGNDQLMIGESADIQTSFDQRTGVLTLSGSASASRYSQLIRTIQYNYITIIEPIRENKIIFIRLSDGQATGEVTRIIQSGEIIADLDIPTAFTPNGDAANDTWVITPLNISEEIEKAILRVYNRDGVLLYESIGFEKHWDGSYRGEHLPADTYYYTIDFNLKYTKNILRGIVTILR